MALAVSRCPSSRRAMCSNASPSMLSTATTSWRRGMSGRRQDQRKAARTARHRREAAGDAQPRQLRSFWRREDRVANDLRGTADIAGRPCAVTKPVAHGLVTAPPAPKGSRGIELALPTLKRRSAPESRMNRMHREVSFALRPRTCTPDYKGADQSCDDSYLHPTRFPHWHRRRAYDRPSAVACGHNLRAFLS